MTKPLHPEIKAIRAVVRAIEPLDVPARTRLLEFVCSRELNLPGFDGRKNVRLSEALRWVRKEGYVDGQVIALIDRAVAEAEARP